MANKHWIAGAVKHPGAMTRAASREGVSNSEFIKEHRGEDTHAGHMANLAAIFKGFHHAGKARHAAK